MPKAGMRHTTAALVRAVKTEWRANVRTITPILDARPEPELRDKPYRDLQFAQNTLRTCLEATLNEMLPYTQDTLVELAIRLASYAISAAPLEDQDFMVSQFVTAFADAHMARVAKGVHLNADWQMNDGRQAKNV